jgi:hypothetical protein
MHKWFPMRVPARTLKKKGKRHYVLKHFIRLGGTVDATWTVTTADTASHLAAQSDSCAPCIPIVNL